MAGSLASRGTGAGIAAHRAGLAAEIHMAAGDQSLSVAHPPIVLDIPYKVNW
jgi:hypothetical protein